MSEVEYAQGLYRQVQAACVLLESNENTPLADETIGNLIHPVTSLQLPGPESDDARQIARKAYWGISNYMGHRYPERKSIIIGYSSVHSSKRHALHFTALLSNCPIWDNILAVSQFIHDQEAGHPPNPEGFNSLVQQANAILLASKSDVELYLALRVATALNNHSFTPDLWRLKKKIRSRLDCRLHKKDRKKWPIAFRQRLFEIQGKACAGCGASFNSHSSMALDHIQSPIWGGVDTPGNLQLLCPTCNGTKNVLGMWHLKERLMEKKRMIDCEAAEQAHNAALSFAG